MNYIVIVLQVSKYLVIMFPTAELLGKVKTALLDCEAKSEQLEETARQLTMQKLR